MPEEEFENVLIALFPNMKPGHCWEYILTYEFNQTAAVPD